MTEREVLIQLLAKDDPTWSTAGHGPFVKAQAWACKVLPAGRRRWTPGEHLKHELATAYAAHRRQDHAGEFAQLPAQKEQRWRKRA